MSPIAYTPAVRCGAPVDDDTVVDLRARPGEQLDPRLDPHPGDGEEGLDRTSRRGRGADQEPAVGAELGHLLAEDDLDPLVLEQPRELLGELGALSFGITRPMPARRS